MDYYFKVCHKSVKMKNTYKHYQSKTHKEFDKCKHMKLTFENPLIKQRYNFLFLHCWAW